MIHILHINKIPGIFLNAQEYWPIKSHWTAKGETKIVQARSTGVNSCSDGISRNLFAKWFLNYIDLFYPYIHKKEDLLLTGLPF